MKDVNQESRQDQWLMYELGGTPLTKMLYELKGEFINGERIYNVRIELNSRSSINHYSTSSNLT